MRSHARRQIVIGKGCGANDCRGADWDRTRIGLSVRERWLAAIVGVNDRRSGNGGGQQQIEWGVKKSALHAEMRCRKNTRDGTTAIRPPGTGRLKIAPGVSCLVQAVGIIIS